MPNLVRYDVRASQACHPVGRERGSVKDLSFSTLASSHTTKTEHLSLIFDLQIVNGAKVIVTPEHNFKTLSLPAIIN